MSPFVPTVEDPPLQAILFRESGDPWRVAVATVLLNCTSRAQVDRVWPVLFDRWPDACALARADVDQVVELLRPLGFTTQRPARLRQMSAAWCIAEIAGQSPLSVAHLPALGRYSDDSHQLFVRGRVDVGLRASDHVVRGWAQLMMATGRRLDQASRWWVPTGEGHQRQRAEIEPGVDTRVGRGSLPFVAPNTAPRDRAQPKEIHPMSTTTPVRISTSTATHELLLTGPKTVKAIAESAREVAKGKGNGVSMVSEATPAQAKAIVEFLTKKAENDKTPKPLARRARTVAARVTKAIEAAAAAKDAPAPQEPAVPQQDAA